MRPKDWTAEIDIERGGETLIFYDIARALLIKLAGQSPPDRSVDGRPVYRSSRSLASKRSVITAVLASQA